MTVVVTDFVIIIRRKGQLPVVSGTRELFLNRLLARLVMSILAQESSKTAPMPLVRVYLTIVLLHHLPLGKHHHLQQKSVLMTPQ
jgi:hypothetical protein